MTGGNSLDQSNSIAFNYMVIPAGHVSGEKKVDKTDKGMEDRMER